MTLRSRLVTPFAVLLLGLLSVPAQAGVGSYPSPLYLAGPPSSLPTMGNSYRLLGNLQAAPTATATGTAGGPAAGTYRYVYTVQSGGTETASLASTTVTSTGDVISVGNLPTGVNVRVWRMNVGAPTTSYLRVALLDNNASSQFSDNVAAPAVALVKAENRVQSGQIPALCTAVTPCTGYFDLSPGLALGGATNNDDITPFPPAAPNKRGWVVDGAGSVLIAAGQWTFTVQTRSVNPNGVAYLTVAMWKVDDNGNVVGAPILAAAENTTNLITAVNQLQTNTITANLGAVSLAENEHLYVQFWRHQNAQYTSGGLANRVTTMYLLDGTARIEHPGAVADPPPPAPTPPPPPPAPPAPVDSTPPPPPSLESPADGATTKTMPTLSVGYNDPGGSQGRVEVRICTGAAPSGSECAGIASSGSVPVAAGGTAVFSSPLLEGNYYWQARAVDAAGNASPWTATRSFTYDVTPPAAPVLEAPAPAALGAASPTLSARFESGDGQGGVIEFRVCSSSAEAGAACADVATSGSASVALSGQSASFTLPSLAGTQHWQARAVDAAGNESPWTATRSFTVDPVPPSVPVLESPRDGFPTRVAPSLRARYDNPDGSAGTLELRVCSDPDCAIVSARASASVASGDSATFSPPLGYGDYYWQARAVDGAGNASAWSATWNVVYTPGSTGRGSQVPLVEVPDFETPVVADPLLGLAEDPVTCRTKRQIAVRVVLRDPAWVSLVLVQRTRPVARWRQVAARHVALEAGAHTVELRIGRALSRDLSYELRVNVTAGAVKESRSVTVQVGGGAATRTSVCNIAP